MFLLGLVLGILLGSTLAIVLIRQLMYYIGEHPEIIEEFLDEATKTFTVKVVDELQKKLDKIKKPVNYISNPFDNTSYTHTTTIQVNKVDNIHEI
jgi:uncharacterized protein YneF (UPF0154 family)